METLIALLCLGMTLLCFLLGTMLLVTEIQLFFAFIACGTFLGIVTIGWMINVLRCPHCQVRIAWIMIKARSHTSWLVDLVALEACPCCHRTLMSP